MRNHLVTLAVALTLASPSYAKLKTYKDWAKSPEFEHYATAQERSGWKNVKTDEEAEAFIALFWARRDPDPKTPVNELRQRVEKLIENADKNFTSGRIRGALSEQGRAFILIGPPKTFSRQQAAPARPSTVTGGLASDSAVAQEAPGSRPGEAIVTFKYEDEQMPPWSEVKRLELVFAVEYNKDYITKGELDARRIQNKARELAIVSPELTQAALAANVETKSVTSPDRLTEIERLVGPTIPETTRGLLDQLPEAGPGSLTAMPLAFQDGATRVGVQLPLAAAPAGGEKLALVARSRADGKDVLRIYEDAAPQASGKTWLVDRSLALPAGDYDVAAAIVAGEKAVSSGRRAVAVPATPKELAASPILLMAGMPPETAGDATQAFVFSGRKAASRPDARLTTKDGLWFAVRVYNAGIDPQTKTTKIAQNITIKPKGRSAIEAPAPPAEPMPAPTVPEGGLVVLDILSGVVDENLGQYFKEGEHTLQLKLTDQVTGNSLNLSAPFVIVK